MKKNMKHIVLIGGGYASIWAYRSLVNELMIEMMMGMVQVKVICPEEFHFYHGWTAESLMGIIQDQNRMSPLKEIFKHAEIIKGKAVQIDVPSRTIHVEMNNGSKSVVVYDQLFIGIGATDTKTVEGLSEHGYLLKSHPAYLRSKMRLQWLISQAAATPSEAQNYLRFVIAGCGFTGVEIASNLAEYIDGLKNQYPSLRNIKPLIYLVNSKAAILPELQSRFNGMRHYAEKTLVQYGVTIIHNRKICLVTSRGVFLNDGVFLESQMVISTIGQSRITLAGTENMERDPEKRIITNTFLQVKNHEEIWGAGDTVHVTHSKLLKACPSNALWAIKQGEHAGSNIARVILSQPPKPFTYKGLGQCASLGIGKGIGEIYGIPFTGRLAWIMRWLFFQYFMPSKKVMWQEIKDWFHLFLTGKRKELTMTKAATLKIISRERILPRDLNQLIYQN